MMRYLLLALAFVSTATPASALTQDEARQCRAMAATFAPKKAEFEELAAQRDELAEAAEAAGEAWEEAEQLRNFGSDLAASAAKADALKVVYDDARAAFDRAQYAWAATGQQLNADFAAFNAKCSSDD